MTLLAVVYFLLITILTDLSDKVGRIPMAISRKLSDFLGAFEAFSGFSLYLPTVVHMIFDHRHL